MRFSLEGGSYFLSYHPRAVLFRKGFLFGSGFYLNKTVYKQRRRKMLVLVGSTRSKAVTRSRKSFLAGGPMMMRKFKVWNLSKPLEGEYLSERAMQTAQKSFEKNKVVRPSKKPFAISNTNDKIANFSINNVRSNPLMMILLACLSSSLSRISRMGGSTRSNEGYFFIPKQ